ncbi:hypothetical protein V6M85_14010 (plasmid) [Sulfolobus tengchongensis]|uniref:Uncharacterized protein n=1 Tax=Sulfolobus tengchongensis TaxID=207809 RepID=A0AAX4L5C4_9CREN
MMELKLTIKQLVIPGLRISGFKEYFMVIIPRAYNNYITESAYNAYLVIDSSIIPLGAKKVTKITNKNYAVFLPKALNEKWKKLYEEKARVDLILEFF